MSRGRWIRICNYPARALTDLAAYPGPAGMNLHKTISRASIITTHLCGNWRHSRNAWIAAAGPNPPPYSTMPPTPGALANERRAQSPGRVDVIWGSEIACPSPCSRLTRRSREKSFQKFEGSGSSAPLWVYFCKDVWGFRTFLCRKADPGKEILAVIVPRTFIPSFADGQIQGGADALIGSFRAPDLNLL